MSARATRAQEGDGSSSLMLYLSVFILLLAFFMLLNALSVPRQDKAGAVRRSVEAAFALDEPGRDADGAPRRRAAREQAVAALRSLGDLIRTEIPLAKVEVAGRGDTLALTLPAGSLYTADGSGILPSRTGLLHRMAAVLFRREAGVQVVGEFLLATDGDPQMLIGRAGVLARAVTGMGAPDGALSVGIERGPPDRVRLLFRIETAADAADAADPADAAAGFASDGRGMP